MKRFIILPFVLFLLGAAVYVYFGITDNAWQENLPNIIIFVIIIALLAWALKKKDTLEKQRKNNQF